MTFVHPEALLLLLAIPSAWWLHRIASRPHVTRVPSVLPYRDAASADPRALRRRADLLIVTASLALLCAALAAAGPSFEKSRGPVAFLAIDDDPWNAALAPGGLTLGEVVRARAEKELRSAVPGVSIEAVAVEALDGVLLDEGAAACVERALAPVLARARAEGASTVLFVSARPERARGLVPALGPGVAPLPDWGIDAVGESLDGTGWARVVRHGHDSRDAPPRTVALRVDDGPPSVLEFDSEGVGRVVIGVVGRGAPVRLQLCEPSGAPWSDALHANDRVAVLRRGGIDVVLNSGGTVGPALRLALAACDVTVRVADAGEIPGPGQARLSLRERVGVADGTVILGVAPLPGSQFGAESGGALEAVAVEHRLLSGAEVRGGEFADVLPSPVTTLVAPVRLRASVPDREPDRARDRDLDARPTALSEVLWSDAHGAVVARGTGWAAVAADPDADGSTWGGDPSLPVVLQSLLDHLGGGPERLVPGADALRAGPAPAALSAVAAPSRDELLRVVAPSRTVRAESATTLVLSTAVCLLLVLLSGLVSGDACSRVFRSLRERTTAP